MPREFIEFNKVIVAAGHKNGWFTQENIRLSLQSWGAILTETRINQWLSPYTLETSNPKEVALILAGNIPLVGFHDVLTVLITGNTALIKLSSNDALLLPYITSKLIEIDASFKNKVRYTDTKLTDFDAVIATGSDNTARYFEYYFGQKPHIIRKNRNAVAVLHGNETTAQLEALGIDIFRYYGLGCRSVSKLFVPKGYNFDTFFNAIYAYKSIILQTKYANNYDYNKAVYLMSEFKLLDNGFLMLKEDESYSSPIATLFYETYTSLDDLRQEVLEKKDKIQCVVSSDFMPNEIPFGQTQCPALSDYADGVDTVAFLLKLSLN